MKHLLACLFAVCSLPFYAQSYQELTEKAIDLILEERLQEAEATIRQALSLEPDNIRNALLFANLGTLQRRQHRYGEAIDSYTYSLNLMPYSVQVLLDRASLYLHTGNPDKAFIDYCQVLDVSRENKEAYHMRAYIYLLRGDYKSSRIDFNKLLEIDPLNYNARFGLATLLQEEKKYNEAIDLLNQLVLEFPQDGMLLIARGGVEREMGQYELAITDFNAALEIDPEAVDAYLLRGDVYLSQNRKQAAREDFEKAIELGIAREELHEQLNRCR